MKKILFRKLLFDCLFFLVISLLSSSLIIWIFQAVNFLDIMVEDGRDYVVYLKYSLLNFPKIISKIIPFAIFFSFFYVLTKYELNNELIIFWNFGINKISLVNFFLICSIFFVVFQIILTVATAAGGGFGIIVGLLLAFLAYSIVQVIGLWRASNLYEGRKLWAILAKVAVILGGVMLAMNFLSLLALFGQR